MGGGRRSKGELEGLPPRSLGRMPVSGVCFIGH